MKVKHNFCIVTSYFNPASFQTKRENYFQFREQFAEIGIPLFTIEQYFTEPELKNSPNVTFVKGGAVLWQKERLLNLAISQLPKNYEFVAWVDCDILFENWDWIEKSIQKLKEFSVIQPYSKVYRLPKGIRNIKEEGKSWNSFGFVYRQNPDLFLTGNFDLHGHTGFAWVARREVLKLGLYDKAILGSGDHMMAHAFAGDWESPCVVRILGRMNPILEDFQTWARKIYSITQARISFVEGSIFHLWHGEEENRQYVSRNKTLVQLGFHPKLDLKIGKNGLWEWKTKNEKLVQFCANYFAHRKEDG